MPSDIQVTNIKANDGTAGLVIADSTGQVTGTLGSATVFPAGITLSTSALTYANDDSAGQTLNTTFGFGTAIGPITVVTGTKIRMFITGGVIFFDTSTAYMPCINYKTGSGFSSTTDGTFPSAGGTGTFYTDSTSKFPVGGPLIIESSNATGSSVDYYFRAGMKSFTSKAGARWYADSGNVSRVFWHQIIKI